MSCSAGQWRCKWQTKGIVLYNYAFKTPLAEASLYVYTHIYQSSNDKKRTIAQDPYIATVSRNRRTIEPTHSTYNASIVSGVPCTFKRALNKQKSFKGDTLVVDMLLKNLLKSKVSWLKDHSVEVPRPQQYNNQTDTFLWIYSMCTCTQTCTASQKDSLSAKQSDWMRIRHTKAKPLLYAQRFIIRYFTWHMLTFTCREG